MKRKPTKPLESLADLRHALESNERGQQQWAAKHARARSEKWKEVCALRLAATLRQHERIAQRIERLELGMPERRKGHAMRAGLVEVPVVETAAPWPWRANVSLRFGDRLFARGSIIPDAVLAASFNADHLVRNGHVRRVPPSPPKQAKFAKNEKTAVSAVPTALARAKARVHAVALERGIGRRAAIDVVAHLDGDLMVRASGERAVMRRRLKLGAWGSGGGSEVEVGEGSGATVRRPVDDFYDFLCSDEPEKAA